MTDATIPAVPLDDAAQPTEPAPFMRGRFSIYATVQGGYHLVWRAEGEAEDQHADVPPMIVKLARKGGMNPMDALRALSGMR